MKDLKMKHKPKYCLNCGNIVDKKTDFCSQICEKNWSKSLKLNVNDLVI